MQLFSLQSTLLTEIKEKPFKLERDIQRVFEANLPAIMGLQLVKSEFTIKNKRIDTLAFDTQSRGFIIIEYKRDRSMSVVDQGFSYLSLMLENKADFIIEYNESLKQNLKRDEVDWSQTRVAFVSTSFTDNQVQATNFKDLAIELWEVKQFENETLMIRPIRKSNAATSIKPLTQNKEELQKVVEETKVYSEDDIKQRGNDEMQELFEKFKAAILNLTDGIEVIPRKQYISFKRGKTFFDITLNSKSIKMWINQRKGQLEDPKKITDDVSQRGHWGNGDYQITVDSDEQLEYIMSLVRQAIIN